MNKKFIVGLSSLALAGTFLACGEGEILTLDGWDEGVRHSVIEENDSTIYKNAIEDCKKDANCKHLVGGDGTSTTVPVATSSAANQNQLPTVSSSSATVPTFRSSSSKVQFASSDSQGAVSSSSQKVVEGGTGDIGTCAPVTNPITKGESTSWKFTFNGKNSIGLTAKGITVYDFEWNFGTSGSKASETITGLSATSAISYANSGVAKASVSITKGAAAYSVQCSDLQVNGAAITGCKCSAAAASVDITEPAAWTVTGCTSAGANITGYTWVGVTGEGASATHTFTEKNQTLAPTVNVANDDNTVQAVVCDEVKSTDASSPDYLLEVAGDQVPQDKIDVANEGCITISGTWSNAYYHPTLTVSCDAKGSNVNLVITYGSESAKGSGEYGVNNIAIPLGSLDAGAVSYQNVCIALTGADVATCGLGTK
ncbi:hypothetical protein [Fibrobacter sp. UWEL]|uniref:hypothetical protein n=1 Tax=Fibrobacter sp. UWEL TaxID=1896209 RepID=UPI000918A11D|nr:hypothetical protein [Fibrobacter sp. UWEL]SHL19194.1 hypothetical protein SAMN05720468_11639 [Fibrobacter sp. UWEL]